MHTPAFVKKSIHKNLNLHLSSPARTAHMSVLIIVNNCDTQRNTEWFR